MTAKRKPFDIIYLGMDGVLADFVSAVLTGYPTHNYDDITEPNMAKLLGVSEEKFWEKLDYWGGAFWEALPLLPNAKAIVEESHRLANHVCFLTSPSLDVNSRHGKIRWVEQHFGRVDLCFSSSGKHPYATGPRVLLVDDFDKNVNAFREAGGSALLAPRPWNSRSEFNYVANDVTADLSKLIELCQDTHINKL